MALETSSINNANLYEEGNSLLGKVEELNLPQVKYAMTEHKVLGLMGVPKFFNSLEAMEGSIKWNSFYLDVAKKFANPMKAIKLMARSSVQIWQGGDLVDEKPLVTHLTVQVSEWPLGNFKKADNVELTTNFSCTSIKQVYDGKTVLEIDVHNNIFSIDGVDLLATYRANLGI
jgi:uncharacterized protein